MNTNSAPNRGDAAARAAALSGPSFLSGGWRGLARGGRAALILGAAAVLGLACGCQTLKGVTTCCKKDAPAAPPPVSQVTAVWKPHVMYMHNSANHGLQVPCLAGDLYLFGKDPAYPILDEGMLVVDLFDERGAAAGAQPAHLEQWRIDKATMAKMARKDVVGDGYTLLLPWSTFRPDLTQVRIMACYVSEKGTLPLYASSGMLTMNHSDRPLSVFGHNLAGGRGIMLGQNASIGPPPGAGPGGVAPVSYGVQPGAVLPPSYSIPPGATMPRPPAPGMRPMPLPQPLPQQLPQQGGVMMPQSSFAAPSVQTIQPAVHLDPQALPGGQVVSQEPGMPSGQIVSRQK